MSLCRSLLLLTVAFGLAVVAEPQESAAAIPDQGGASPLHWQGWYVGGNAGLTDTTNSFDNPGNGSDDIHGYGGTVGLVGGYNWVRSDGLFYGAEADINYMSNAQHSTMPATVAPIESLWNGYGTMRGRIGMAFDPALVFLTGGLALADVSNKWHSPTFVQPAGVYGLTSAGIEAGWTFGAGAEFALTKNISMSAQYLMLGMPSTTRSAIDPSGGQHKLVVVDSANILRVGMNWHFD